ncbi:hypothetical protein K2173_000703 [Erythroxylum novogranatense]|uniref:RNase H type-1 domain-containing protein n=1 Tax=Erythroxylum novogranatense TaxID=1862640 RepID=A0AAV8SI75_9ROSI|nr:hypothetical protein K2173_000703 [Erythroxylum novogranatense]
MTISYRRNISSCTYCYWGYFELIAVEEETLQHVFLDYPLTKQVNVEAAIESNSNFMAAAAVVRDSNSSFIAVKSWKFPSRLSAKSAEATTIREVLSWVKLQNWDIVIIESDAKIVVQAINDGSYEDSSSFDLLVCDCQAILLFMS